MSHTAHAGEEVDYSKTDSPLKKLFPSCDTQEYNSTDPFCSLPHELILRIMSFLPSSLLFECRVLSKAVHAFVLLALSRRPFFVYQSTSSQCFLLPLDSPSTPLPCTFTLGISSFVLEFASHNLLCMRRRYHSMLEICVCDIFRKWKVTVPPIVHPDYAPHIFAMVLLEEPDVDSLSVIGFHASDHHPYDGSPHFRIFVANNAFLHVFDSCLNQWSPRAHFPAHLCTQIPRTIHYLGKLPTPPHCFVASDGTIILTFINLGRVTFNYRDLSFHVIEVLQPTFPSFELAGYHASACVASFNLEIHLPHVEDLTRSNHSQGLVLKGLCKGDDDDCSIVVPCGGADHQHFYRRCLLHSYCHAYKNMVYALVMEQMEISCSNEFREPPRGWHDLPMEERENYLCCPDENFLAHSSRKLMLYTACIDTTDWTLQILSRTDTTALLSLAERNNWEVGNNDARALLSLAVRNNWEAGKFLLMEG